MVSFLFVNQKLQKISFRFWKVRAVAVVMTTETTIKRTSDFLPTVKTPLISCSASFFLISLSHLLHTDTALPSSDKK